MKKILIIMLVIMIFLFTSCSSQISQQEYDELSDKYSTLEDKYYSVSGKYEDLCSIMNKMYVKFLKAYNYFDDPVTSYTFEDAYGALIDMREYFSQAGY